MLLANILKFMEKFLKKTSLSVLFEHLLIVLLKYVCPFVTTQHKWVNNFPGFIWKKIDENVGRLVSIS